MKYDTKANVIKYICTLLIVLICSSTIYAKPASHTQYNPVVKYLQYIVNNDAKLKQTIIDSMRLAGKKYPYWKNKNLNDFYLFFNTWLTSQLKPIKGDQFIVHGEILRYSYLFYRLINTTDTLRSNNNFMGWLALFMNARQQFLLSPASAKYLHLWMKEPAIHINEYIVPIDGFKSFDAFFLRKIKPSARPIAAPKNPMIAVSPVDCRVFHLYNVKLDHKISLKGDMLGFSQILNGVPLANKFAGGDAYTCNLVLTNYHHFHSPVSGKIVSSKLIGGIYYFDKGFTHLYSHRRAYFIIDSKQFGYVAFVAVGQIMINSITLIHHTGDTVTKGEELGNFDFGGSEIVMIFQQNKAKLAKAVRPNNFIKMGEKIARAL